MTKTIPALKTEFRKEVDIVKRNDFEKKMKLKKLMSRL